MKTKIKQEDKLEKNINIYRKEMEILEKKYNGRLTPADVVRESANRKSKLHDWFDWDDNSASEKWRLHQARMLISSIKVNIMLDRKSVV